MGAKDIVKYQFKKGQSGNPNGRPRNRVSSEWLPNVFGKDRAKKIKDLTDDEVNTWERRLMVAGTPELLSLLRWEGCPSYAKGIASAILQDTKNGKTNTIDKLRERQYGKPVQKIELTGADGEPLIKTHQTMTQQEAREFLKKLDQDC